MVRFILSIVCDDEAKSKGMKTIEFDTLTSAFSRAHV